MATVASEHDTETVALARADARAQGGRVADAMPYRPASSTPYPPAGVDKEKLTWAETVAGGNYTHQVVARGTRIRLADVTGEACAHLLLYNALEPWERLNVADTVKIPWQAYLTTGHPLLSGDGRVLATIVADDSGQHDALCGTSTAAASQAKYGDSAPQGPSPVGTGAVHPGGGEARPDKERPPAVRLLLQGRARTARRQREIHRQRRPGQGRRPARRAPADRPHRQRAAPGRPAPGVHLRTAAGARVALGTDAPGRADASPEAHRAYLNTAAYLAARGL